MMLIDVLMLLVRMWNMHEAGAKPCSHVCLSDPASIWLKTYLQVKLLKQH